MSRATEKLENTEFNLFDALNAIDRKDYGYFDRLTEEQQAKFSSYMLTKWLSYVSGSDQLQQYYVLATNEFVNKHLFNDNVMKHPKLLWYMMCAAGSGKSGVRRQWMPQIKEKIAFLKEAASNKEIKEYFSKIYPNADQSTIKELTDLYVTQQKKRFYIATKFPAMKYQDIHLLADMVTDEEIQQYEQQSGNG